jgi:hypothetical protein
MFKHELILLLWQYKAYYSHLFVSLTNDEQIN